MILYDYDAKRQEEEGGGKERRHRGSIKRDRERRTDHSRRTGRQAAPTYAQMNWLLGALTPLLLSLFVSLAVTLMYLPLALHALFMLQKSLKCN